MHFTNQSRLSRRMLSEAAAWLTVLAATLLLGAHVPKPFSSFAYGFGTMVGVAVADIASALAWQRWRSRRRSPAEVQGLWPRPPSVVRNGLVGGLWLAFVEQFQAIHPDALLWVGYWMQGALALVVAAIGIWAWSGKRQQRCHRE